MTPPEILRARFTVPLGYWSSWIWSDPQYEVVFTPETLVMCNVHDDGDKLSICVTDILWTKCLTDAAEDTCTLEVYHVITAGFVKSVQTITLRGPRQQCQQWNADIRHIVIHNYPNRPKRLLAFLSPKSGNGQSVQVYHRDVKPILDMCEIEVDLKVTPKKSYPQEVLQDYDLSTVDGIVASGGDGTYWEVFTGLLERTAKDAGIDLNDPDVQPPAPSFPVGVIATGTRSETVNAIHQTLDPATSTIAIMQGETCGKDIGTLTSGGKHVCLVALMAAFGFVYDFMRISEKIRWLGAIRYTVVALVAKKRLNRAVNMEIEFLNADSKKRNRIDDTSSKHVHGDTSKTSDEASFDNPNTGWETISGHYNHVDIQTFNMNSIKRECVIHSGEMILYCIKQAPYFQNLKSYGMYWRGEEGAFSAENVFARKASVIRARAIGDWKDDPEAVNLTVDGELLTLPAPEFEMRFHPGLIQIYGKDLFSNR